MSTNGKPAELDVLLIHPPWFRLQGTTLIHYPPGPAYIAAVLERAGMKAAVWNTDIEIGRKIMIGGTNVTRTDELTAAHRSYLDNLRNPDFRVWREIRERLAVLRPKAVGVSVYSCSYESALNLARISKEVLPDAPVVFGGIHPTIDPDDCLRHGTVDVVVLGEGEETACELFPVLLRRGPSDELARIKGIAFLRDGLIVNTGRRELIADLDALPLPARHLVLDVEAHPPGSQQALYGFRGCPYGCIFCGSFNIWGKKQRSRSGDALAEEIAFVHKTYKTRYFYVCDDDFMIQKERLFEFCEGLRKRRLRIYFSVQSRGEQVTEEALRELKSVGCQHVSVGVETGDPDIRKLIQKGNTNEDILRAAKLIRRHGLRMVGFFMIGFPWETEAHIQRTVKFMEELNPVIAFPYIVTPSPGTKLAKIAMEMGLIPPDVNYSEYYHESPTMALSANIPKERHQEIINRTLASFAAHNKRSLRRDFFTRPGFYIANLLDTGLLSNPRTFFNHLVDLI